MYRGLEATLDGDLEAAERHVMAAVSRGIRVVGSDAARFCGSQLKMIRRLQGREAEMIEAFTQFADQNPHHLDGQWALVEVLANEGQIDEARRRFDVLPPLAQIPEDFEWLHAVCWAALAAVQLEAKDIAKDAAALLTPFTDRLCTAADASMSFSVAHVLGRIVAWLGDSEQGLELLDHAKQLYARLGARPWLVLTAVDAADIKVMHEELTMTDIGSLELARAEADAIGMPRSIEAIDRFVR